MFKTILKLIKYGSQHGVDLPTAYDHDKKGPSVSLLFANISFYVAIGAIIYLIHKDVTSGTIAATLFAGLYFIFYMLRKLTKARIDFDNKEIDLENNETPEVKETDK